MEYHQLGSITRLSIKKVIYAQNPAKTYQQVLDILDLEATTHLRENPDLEFDADKYNPVPKENADRSQTYTLPFKLKQ